jgi:hypothetical protein
VQLLGDATGPSGDVICVAHVATRTYLGQRRAPVGIAALATPDAPVVVRLNRRPMPPGTLVAAALDLDVDDGAVDAFVVAAPDRATALTLVGGTELPGDGHRRRGEYDLTQLRVRSLSYVVGQAEPSVMSLGWPDLDRPDVLPLRPDETPLAGEYGIARPLMFTLSNPTATPHTVYLYLSPSNGTDTLTMAFDDLDAPIEVPRVTDAGTAYAVRAFSLSPNQQLNVPATFMSDGGSWYPLLLGLSETPPVSVDPAPLAACTRALGDR